MRLRAASIDDAEAIARIYAPYVTASAVSFETEAPTPAEMKRRIETGRLYPWIVAVDEADAILGYAYATAFRARRAYRFAVETSVYVEENAQGQGIGSLLYRTLLATLEAQAFTQAIAAIAIPNAPSIRLHERMGFAFSGTHKQVGYKLGRWLDVGLWQRPLAAPAEPPIEPREFSGIISPDK